MNGWKIFSIFINPSWLLAFICYSLLANQLSAQETSVQENLEVLAEAGLDIDDLKTSFTRSKLNAVIETACGAGGSADGCGKVLASAAKVAASYDTSKGSAVIWMSKKLEQNLPKLASKGADARQLSAVVQSTTSVITEVKKGTKGIDGAVEKAGFEIVKAAITEIAKVSSASNQSGSNSQNTLSTLTNTLASVNTLGSLSLSQVTSRIGNKIDNFTQTENGIGDVSSQISVESLSSITQSISQEVTTISEQREIEGAKSQETTVQEPIITQSEILPSIPLADDPISQIYEPIDGLSQIDDSLSNIDQLYWPDGTPLSPEDNQVYLEQRRMISESGYEIDPSLPAPLQ